MATKNVTLRWDDTNNIEVGHRIYRSDMPMDTTNMPSPIGVVSENITEYIDEDRAVGNTYYYRVSAFIDGDERFSDEISIVVTDVSSVYSASDDNTIKMINSDGSENWTYTEFSESVSSIKVLSDNTVIAGSVNNIHKIDTDSTMLWETTVDGSVIDIVLGYMNRVYALTDTGRYYKFNDDGSVMRVGNTVNGTSFGVDNRNNIYIGTNSDVTKYDEDGAIIWKNEDIATQINEIYIDYDENVYLACEDNRVIKLNRNGSIQWEYTEHTNTVNSIAVDENYNVYSSSNDTTVKKIDENGNEVWSYNGNDSNVVSVKVDVDGFVYSGNINGLVHKINSQGNNEWISETHTESVNDLSITILESVNSVESRSVYYDLANPETYSYTTFNKNAYTISDLENGLRNENEYIWYYSLNTPINLRNENV